jgi:TetR/AcrR family transcriptional regulator, transcriptional repressor for nem operon
MIIESSDDSTSRPAGCLVTNLVSELLNVVRELGEGAAAGLVQMQQALQFRIKLAKEYGDLGEGQYSDALGAYFMVAIQGMLVMFTATKDVVAMRAARDAALAILPR